MRIARILHGGRPVHAVVEGDGLALLDDLRPAPGPQRHTVPLAGARLLAPADPRVVLGMAHNTGPADRLLPPQAFLKPSRTVVGPGAPIPLPDGIGHVDAEGELAVVIGTTARHLTAADALDAVLGYTVANDVTARDLQRTDPLWTAAKGQDAFTPLGPWIETDLDAFDAEITVSRNGSALRGAATRDLARGRRRGARVRDLVPHPRPRRRRAHRRAGRVRPDPARRHGGDHRRRARDARQPGRRRRPAPPWRPDEHQPLTS